jgi:hypothetical protein
LKPSLIRFDSTTISPYILQISRIGFNSPLKIFGLQGDFFELNMQNVHLDVGGDERYIGGMHTATVYEG